MSKINIDPELVQSYGNEVIAGAESYNKEITKIYEYIDELKATWTGSAAQRFTDNIESFREDYQKFGELINNFGELLVAIGKDYQSLENDL